VGNDHYGGPTELTLDTLDYLEEYLNVQLNELSIFMQSEDILDDLINQFLDYMTPTTTTAFLIRVDVDGQTAGVSNEFSG
jgi:hypothetical protein